MQILKHCQNYYQNLYTKYQTCKETQNALLLKHIKSKVPEEHNKQLTKPLAKNEIKHAIFQMENRNPQGLAAFPLNFIKNMATY